MNHLLSEVVAGGRHTGHTHTHTLSVPCPWCGTTAVLRPPVGWPFSAHVSQSAFPPRPCCLGRVAPWAHPGHICTQAGRTGAVVPGRSSNPHRPLIASHGVDARNARSRGRFSWVSRHHLDCTDHAVGGQGSEAAENSSAAPASRRLRCRRAARKVTTRRWEEARRGSDPGVIHEVPCPPGGCTPLGGGTSGALVWVHGHRAAAQNLSPGKSRAWSVTTHRDLPREECVTSLASEVPSHRTPHCPSTEGIEGHQRR